MVKGMFDTPGSVKTLRRYWKNRAALPDPTAVAAELTGESDRATVILLGTLLDDVLTYALTKRLPLRPDENQFDYIFRYEGPLGTFSSRSETAYLFGIIDQATYEQLYFVRELRNACAHTKQRISFDDAVLVNVAKNLFRPRGVIEQPAAANRHEIRNAFIVECIFLYQTILHGSRDAAFKEMAPIIASLASGEPSPSLDRSP